MLNTSLFSILFFSVCVVLLSSGILVLQNNYKAPANRIFFALIIAITLWSSGLALATIAPNVATCEIWRRFSAIGWGAAYAILLHFILIITGRTTKLKKWWSYLILYIPAIITIFSFAVPNNINPTPYQLYLTEYGWVNVSENNIWDIFFYVYYISYTVMVLILVYQWGRKSSDSTIKKQSRTIFASIIAALIVGSLTDVILSSVFSNLPQMAPVIMLIPILAIYHVLKVDSFKISEPIGNKSSYMNIIVSVTLYVIISFFLVGLSTESTSNGFINLKDSTYRGIITQLQLLISIYLVIKENKPGYIAAVLMNTTNLLGSVGYFIVSKSTESLPGIISYLGALMLVFLIKTYKNKAVAYIDRINSQRNSLEESERKLYKLAYYDSLTGLPNRDLFMNRLNKSILIAKRNASLIGVMFLDFDSFKSINDTLGHSSGDIVLKQFAEQLSSCLREQDTIARFGGDEFIIMISDIEKIEDLYKTSNKIIDILKNPISFKNDEYFVSASIGVAVYPIDGEDSESLIKNANIAMYSAKNKGKKQCIYCTPEIKEDIVKKLRLTNSLYRALEKNELFLHYQPQVKVETKEICGFEALLRWNNEEYGMISPITFIPMAEQTGLIKPIGLWVMQTACEQLKKFRNIYNKDINISVNLSLIQLKDPSIAYKIKNILAANEMDARNLQIEITESIAFNEEPYILPRIQEIKNLGVSISIDDFGTGHSSFSRLKIFPIDLLKIDIEFVQGISSKSQKDRAIIKSIIQIAENLGVEVLAEGVETKDQFNYLRDSSCGKIQGYYFYKPMSANEVESILKNIT
ncbi:MAG: EAL domain-containing protein [Vulcanibacillus sp.]